MNAAIWFGALLILLALPLTMGKVRRNRLYGFRTQATLGDERVWQAANRASGYALLIAGIVTVGAGVWASQSKLGSEPYFLLVVIPLPLLASLVVGARAAQRAAERVKQGG